ncbi:hypothetical protein EDD86DRAFT_202892 [Gorgonomyces haynaldii]|nr:hypothetical protein EDD86DRAFT_202892 [Gorgonomyces haynaldii]
MSKESQAALDKWHKCIFERDLKLLHELLADDVVFHTPLYMKPRVGRLMVHTVLSAAISNFTDFKYLKEIISSDGLQWALEFEALVDGKIIQGIDLMVWKPINGTLKIVDFKVFLRPLKQIIRFGELQKETIERLLKERSKL